MFELFIFSSSDNNNECEMFTCECDRKAAECFARSPWNPEHEHLPVSIRPLQKTILNKEFNISDMFILFVMVNMGNVI